MARLRSLLIKLSLALFVMGALWLVYLDARITATFTDKMWELPARVYARPLELFADARLTPTDLAYELQLLGYRQVSTVRRAGDFSRYRDRFEIYTRGFAFPEEREPSWRVMVDFRGERVASLAAGGRRVDLMRLDPLQIGGIYPQHGEDRLLVRLEQVPEVMRAGLLAVEDRNFPDHWGFSPSGILRAALSNLRSGRVVAGGSTITQQLVKNYYLTPERTIVRKLRELVMAVLLELHYDKQQILESYVNEVYLGQEGPRAIHGFALAARHYFNTPLEQLGLHQQALLIGMIKGPSLYNPLRNPERATRRRNLVLQVMQEQGIISAEHARVASAMPLGLNASQRVNNSFPAFLDLVRRQLRREYRDEDLTRKGLNIFTTFDPLLQRHAERSTSRVLERIDPGGDLESASVVTRLDTGEVAALVGGRRPRYAGFNRALDARRPAGSLLKPALYLAALERPARYSLATPLQDTPFTQELGGGRVWEPRNFDRQPHGEVLLYQALANSYNLASARLGMELGLDSVVETLARLGVTEGVTRVPALTLGAGEYSPLAMATLYQSIAAGGYRLPLRSIRNVTDAHGEILSRYLTEYERVASLQATYLLHFALQEVVRGGTGRGVYRYLPQDFVVAGKTGTTNEGRDSWFAGFSGDLVAVTWIGRDDNSGTGLTGASGALQVWSRFMADASRQSFRYRQPQGIRLETIDTRNGYLTGQGCPYSRMLPFVPGSEPRGRTDCSPRQPGSAIKDWFRKLFSGG
ncbi:MAG: penicillin-binding protein 1B [Halioglobus sp.]|nr:penicillin-binding protein 1B [Halioglobus sp.]|tara:strand:- start:106 stop:2364 length:2259 start_codon:yes stop_codon:yes gene_type:complete